MSDPLKLLEPSTESVHFEGGWSGMLSSYFSAFTGVLGVKSTMNSTNTWDLMKMQG